MKREFGLPHLIRFPILPELSEAGDGVPPTAPAWEFDMDTYFGRVFPPLVDTWDAFTGLWKWHCMLEKSLTSQSVLQAGSPWWWHTRPLPQQSPSWSWAQG